MKVMEKFFKLTDDHSNRVKRDRLEDPAAATLLSARSPDYRLFRAVRTRSGLVRLESWRRGEWKRLPESIKFKTIPTPIARTQAIELGIPDEVGLFDGLSADECLLRLAELEAAATPPESAVRESVPGRWASKEMQSRLKVGSLLMTRDCAFIRVEEIVDEGVISRTLSCPRGLWDWAWLDRWDCHISVDDNPRPEGFVWQDPEVQNFGIDEPIDGDRILEEIAQQVDSVSSTLIGATVLDASAVYWGPVGVVCDVAVTDNGRRLDVSSDVKLFGLIAEFHRWARLCQSQPWESLRLVIDASRHCEVVFSYRIARKQILAWDYVVKSAGPCFDIWHLQPQLAWAERAWSALIEAGFATFGTDAERVVVKLRFLALVLIYHDWCHVGCDERLNYDETQLADWCDSLDLNPYMFFGTAFEWSPPLSSEDELADEDEEGRRLFGIGLIKDAANALRPEVVRALKDRFGGDAGLFVSLVRSASLVDEVHGDDDDSMSRDDDDFLILNTVTADRLDGYQWVCDNCTSIQ
jgi:hypothetical protein